MKSDELKTLHETVTNFFNENCIEIIDISKKETISILCIWANDNISESKIFKTFYEKIWGKKVNITTHLVNKIGIQHKVEDDINQFNTCETHFIWWDARHSITYEKILQDIEKKWFDHIHISHPDFYDNHWIIFSNSLDYLTLWWVFSAVYRDSDGAKFENAFKRIKSQWRIKELLHNSIWQDNDDIVESTIYVWERIGDVGIDDASRINQYIDQTTLHWKNQLS